MATAGWEERPHTEASLPCWRKGLLPKQTTSSDTDKNLLCFLSAASCSLLRPTLPFSPAQVLSLAPLPVLRRMWEGAHQKNASSCSRCFSCRRKGQILIRCLMPETSVGWFWQSVPGFPPRSLIVVSTPLLGIGLQQPHGLGSASQEQSVLMRAEWYKARCHSWPVCVLPHPSLLL